MSRTEASRPGRVGRPWREVSAQVYAEETHCWLCGRYVDQRLDPRHPRSRSADHLRQLQHGGVPTDRANLRLACRGCNSGRSNALRGLPVERCACSVGRPCAVLVPEQKRGFVALRTSEV
jgi:5-methylcytosine-specific restriction endonuclease McrA